MTVTEERGRVHVPAASISVLMLGPGTQITHRGMKLIGDSGVTVIWVGESGIRYDASGRPLTHRTGLLMRQAALISNMRSHLKAARQMYQMRFPNEDVSAMTMQQLRGREGARVREIDRQRSAKWQVPWNGRQENGLPLSDVMQQFLSFVADRRIVCHHAAFADALLKAACRKCHLPEFRNPYADTSGKASA